MRRSIDFQSEMVRALDGHARCRSAVCLICHGRIQWNKRAKYLPEEPSIVHRINSILPKPLDLNDVTLATSICGSCNRGLCGTAAQSFEKRVIASVASASDATPAGGRAMICKQSQHYLTIYKIKAQPQRVISENMPHADIDPDEKVAAPHVISAAEFASAAAAVNLSGRKAELFAQALKAATSNRTVVAPGTRGLILNRNKRYQQFHSWGQLESFGGSSVVWISEPQAFYRALESADDGFDPAEVVLVRCNIDGGGGAIKLSVCFVKRLHSASSGMSVAVRSSGVRKMYTYVYVTGVGENVGVVRAMLSLFDTAALEKKIVNAKIVWAQDTKMNWFFAGMTQGGTYSCVCCYWRSSDGFNNSLEARTFGGNAEHVAAYSTETMGQSRAFCDRMRQKHKNVVRPALVQHPPHVAVGDKLSPEPLHMKLRTMNKLVTHLKVAAPVVAKRYLARLSVRTEGYHGEYEGRQCSKLAGGYEILESLVMEECTLSAHAEQARQVSRKGTKRQRLSGRQLEHSISGAVLQHPATPFARAFAAMDGVMKHLYGSTVDGAYSNCVNDFKLAIRDIGCSVSVSMHMLMDHAPAYCAKMGHSLQRVSAEAHESLHHEASVFTVQWKVPPAGTDSHACVLHRMVSGMNAAHAFSSLQ